MKLKAEQCIHDVMYNRYLERIRKEKREKQVMLDLWYIATKGKQIIIIWN